MNALTRRRATALVAIMALLAGMVTLIATNAMGAQSGTGRLTLVLADQNTGRLLANDCALTFVVQGGASAAPVVDGEGRCVGEHGRVSFAGLPGPERYTVQIRDLSHGYAIAGGEPQYFVQPGREIVGRLPMVRTGAVAGTITDAASGSPDANDCTVRVLVGDGAGDYLGCTDAHGRYRVDDVKPGTYSVQFTSYKYATTYWPKKVVVSSERVTDGVNDMVRPGGGSPTPSPIVSASPTPSPSGNQPTGSGQLTLVLTNKHTGTTLAGDCALTFGVFGQRSGYTYFQRQCVGTDGHVTFNRIPAPDYYLVRVLDRSNNFVGTLGGRRASVQPDQETVLDLPQARTGAVSGRITFISTGEPDADDCGVRVDVGDGEAVFDGCTDSRGRYRLDGVKPRTYPVAFESNGHPYTYYPNAPSQADGQAIRVRAEQLTRGVDGVLQQGGTLQVTVVNVKTGKAMPRAFVGWHLLNATRYELLDFDEWHTSCSGKFTAHRIFAARYKLFVRLVNDYTPDQWYDGTKYGNAAVLRIRNKQTTRITIRVDPSKVSSHAVRGKPGAPC